MEGGRIGMPMSLDGKGQKSYYEKIKRANNRSKPNYICSHCGNGLRMPRREMGDRKILCTKCSSGFFVPVKK